MRGFFAQLTPDQQQAALAYEGPENHGDEQFRRRPEMTHCPTCGQLVSTTRDADWLLDVLTNSVPHREVYHGQRGGWWLTYGHGEVPAESVRELVQRGAIVSVYSNCPDDAYHVGRTLDIDRTLEARKRLGKGAPEYYLQQTPGA